MKTADPPAATRLPSPVRSKPAKRVQPLSDPSSWRLVDRYRRELQRPGLARSERTVLKLKIGLAECLDSRTYAALRVADVSQTAGVAYGSFYRYFQDTQHIALIVLEDFLKFSTTIYDGMPSSTDPYDSIYQSNFRFITVYRQNAGLMRALLALSDELGEFRAIWDKVVDEWHQRLGRRIARDQATAEAIRSNADLTAYCLGGMIDQVCRLTYTLNHSALTNLVRSDEHLAEVVSMIWFRTVFDRRG